MLLSPHSLLLGTSRFASLSIHGHDMQLRKQLCVVPPQFLRVWMIAVVTEYFRWQRLPLLRWFVLEMLLRE